LAIPSNAKTENSNIEIRNNIKNPKVQNSKHRQEDKAVVIVFWSFAFWPLGLFRVSIFEFRISVSLAVLSNGVHYPSNSSCHFSGQNI
jgi:hypothetical protein